MKHACLVPRSTQRVLVLSVVAAACCPLTLSAQDRLVVDQVIDGIRRNYEQMGSVRATVQEHRRNRSVNGEKDVKVSVQPNSTTVFTSYADLWATLDFVAARDDYRFTRRPSHNEEREIFVKKANEWILYSEGIGSSRASIWKTSQLPGMLPMDPREFACDQLKKRVIDLLRDHIIVSTDRVRQGQEGELIRIVTRRAPGAIDCIWEFDPKMGFLPVRRFNTWPNDQSLLQVVEIGYRDVLQGNARFPTRMVRRFYDKGVAKDLDSQQWRQQTEWFVTKLDVRNAEASNVTSQDIEIDFKSGTRVSDSVRRKVWTVP